MSQNSGLRIAVLSGLLTLLVGGSLSLAYSSGALFSSEPQSGLVAQSSLHHDDAQSQPSKVNAAEDKAQSASSQVQTPDPAPEPEPTYTPIPVEKVDCAVQKCVALTFDDGPHQDITPRILDTLRETKTLATFFQLGRQMEGNEAILQRAKAEGHVLGTHTWDHPQLPLLNDGDMRWQMDAPKDQSKKITGEQPTLIRPPYGLFNDAVIAHAAQSNDAVIMWDVDTEDWKNKDPQETTRRAVDGAHRGAIILLHDVHPSTADALPMIIQELRAQGYTLVTIPQLLGDTPAGSIHYSGALDE